MLLSAEKDKQHLKKILALRYKEDIEDYMTQKTYYNRKLGLKGLTWVAQIALGLPSLFKDSSSMKLGRTYDAEDYEETIMVIGHCHEERQKDIEHEMKLDEAWGKNDNGKGKDFSKPERSNHKSDRKKRKKAL
jgi:hypothetical protein